MASTSFYYRDENARQTHRHGHSERRPVEESPRVKIMTQGEETAIQATDHPISPMKSLREDGNDMIFLDDIALLRRGYINKSSIKNPFARTSLDGSASPPLAANDRPITLTELESRGLYINGKVVYTLPRGTKYSSKARESKQADNGFASTSKSWITTGSEASSSASVAALVNDSKKPAVKAGEMQRLPDGTMVEKVTLGKGGVRYLIETNERITTVEKKKGGSVIFSSLKGQ
ncbi:hypothetical protein PMAYCL1PPCAC_18836 [Pristionchus mayeri]|uniref:Uncharacterized protein n=1 Tax=Pristionchus mayeri TaxID=1317129 RepID=A0AAN5CQ78_9BILA|nr:hypothetical protein PMAYCL1PPCAC_18836 [Pristionchus mayeri]